MADLHDGLAAAQRGLITENIEDVRDQYPAPTVKDCCNTSVLGLRYRIGIDPKWR